MYRSRKLIVLKIILYETKNGLKYEDLILLITCIILCSLLLVQTFATDVTAAARVFNNYPCKYSILNIRFSVIITNINMQI
jgi:hypothetical protein